jgi:DNA-binding PadR family transcriptional regulator
LGRYADAAVLVLTSLANGDRHGYAIMEDIAEFSGTKLEPGTLYAAISRLEQRGWIRPMPADERRQPYRLTEDGAQALGRHLAAMSRVVSTGLTRLRVAT